MNGEEKSEKPIQLGALSHKKYPQPKLSIIMNCLNGSDFLEEAILSIYEQDFDSWEIIFIDNASSDSSPDIVKKFDSKIKYFRLDEIVPLGTARNIAIEKSSSQFIAFLDCDDVYLPFKLSQQINLMEKNNFAMSYGGCEVIDEFGHVFNLRIPNTKSGYIFGELLLHYDINMQSVMLRRDILCSFNLNFPVGYEYGPDYDLFMQIASVHQVGVINTPIVRSRVHRGALSNSKMHLIRSELKFSLDKIRNEKPYLFEKFKKEFCTAYDKFEYYHAIYHLNEGRRREAIQIMFPVFLKRWQYCLLFIALFAPVKTILIYKMIRR